MRVDEVMTRNVRTATTETRLEEVAAVMCLNRLSGLPVVDGDDRLVGFVAERDILHYLFPSLDDLMENSGIRDFEQMEQQYGATLGLTVTDVMHKGVIPVADADGQLVGIVSIGDIHKALFKHNLLNSQQRRAA